MRRRKVLWSVAVLAVLALAVGVVVLRPVVFPGRQPLVAAAWLQVSDPRAAESLPRALDSGLTEVSPTLASVTADGQLAVTAAPAEVTQLLGRSDVRVIPTVQNYLNGGWQGDLVAQLLSDPVKAAAHRTALVQAAVDNGWDGLDVDYEALPPTAGPAFADFLTALRADLHAHDLTLTVAVPARTDDEDPDGLAYSYRVIGEVVDQVRLMTYDYSWNTSEAGPIAPLEWVQRVIAYASKRVPKDKLMLGLATYGYDWVGSRGTTLEATDAVALAAEMGITPTWDSKAAGWTFDYEKDGQQHTVWYEDARSLAAKQQLAVDGGLRGVAIWSLGGEDPAVWTAVADVTGGSTT